MKKLIFILAVIVIASCQQDAKVADPNALDLYRTHVASMTAEQKFDYFGTLSFDVKRQIWKYKFIEDAAKFSGTQKDYILKVSEGQLSKDYKWDDLSVLIGMFGEANTRSIFFDLDGIKAEITKTHGSTSSRVDDQLLTCNCSTVQDWCFWGFTCKTGGTCTINWGDRCGNAWSQVCNGLCISNP